jgi:hypothetical protein
MKAGKSTAYRYRCCYATAGVLKDTKLADTDIVFPSTRDHKPSPT